MMEWLIAIPFIALIGFIEYLNYKKTYDERKKLYDLVDDLFDRKNAGDFDKYALGKRLKKDKTIPIDFPSEEEDVPQTQKFPEFLNQDRNLRR